MPQGIDTVIEDGFAFISFPDPTKRGPSLAALLRVTPPELISVDTGGVRKVYIVPEGNAREAGLIDGPRAPAKTAESADEHTEPEEELTPHQKAARTRAANKRAAEARTAGESDDVDDGASDG